jgi:tRNA uracil 4-sulfurtransferase
MTVKVLVRYGEIALKGKNRGQFEQQMHRNLKGAVKDCGAEVSRMHGRFMISGPDEQLNEMLERLSRVFGVVSISQVWETKLDLEAIKESAVTIVASLPADQNSFKIEARRSNKRFPYPSPEISRLLGAHLLENFGSLRVDLHKPLFKLSVEIGFDKAFLYLARKAGPGGLPMGITGRSLLLLSGGIDSPAAGWLAMKRGLALEAVHFHSFPLTSRHSQEKAIDLCRSLAQYSGKIALHMVSVTNIQKELRVQCPEDLGVILLRRMMFRLADLICEQRNLRALITGENLGQVASQTLESIYVVEKATNQLVLRPVIGMDKSEIINLAVTIGSYEVSIRPYEDCCTLFVPKSPVTKPKLAVVEKFEEKLAMEVLLEEAIASLETIIIKR